MSGNWDWAQQENEYPTIQQIAAKELERRTFTAGPGLNVTLSRETARDLISCIDLQKQMILDSSPYQQDRETNIRLTRLRDHLRREIGS